MFPLAVMHAVSWPAGLRAVMFWLPHRSSSVRRVSAGRDRRVLFCKRQGAQGGAKSGGWGGGTRSRSYLGFYLLPGRQTIIMAFRSK